MAALLEASVKGATEGETDGMRNLLGSLRDTLRELFAMDSGLPLDGPKRRRPLVSWGKTDLPGVFALRSGKPRSRR